MQRSKINSLSVHVKHIADMLYYITVQASSGIQPQKEVLNKAAKPCYLIATRPRIISKKNEGFTRIAQKNWEYHLHSITMDR